MTRGVVSYVTTPNDENESFHEKFENLFKRSLLILMGID